jgi:hypothetical protein
MASRAIAASATLPATLWLFAAGLNALPRRAADLLAAEGRCAFTGVADEGGSHGPRDFNGALSPGIVDRQENLILQREGNLHMPAIFGTARARIGKARQ